MRRLACGYWAQLLPSLHGNSFLAHGWKLRDEQPLLRSQADGCSGWRLLPPPDMACSTLQSRASPTACFYAPTLPFFDYEQPWLLSILEVVAIFVLSVLTGFYLKKLVLSLAGPRESRALFHESAGCTACRSDHEFCLAACDAAGRGEAEKIAPSPSSVVRRWGSRGPCLTVCEDTADRRPTTGHSLGPLTPQGRNTVNKKKHLAGTRKLQRIFMPCLRSPCYTLRT